MNERPERSDPKWSNWVLSLLEEDEMYNGNPTTDGLRRIGEIVIGPIIYSASSVIQAPNPGNNSTATVEHTVEFYNKFAKPGEPDRVLYRDVADSSPDNTPPEYSVFPSATCATKAEGRALRKALGLKRVIAAEESSSFNEKDMIRTTESQIGFLDKECKQNDINVREFIKYQKGKSKINKNFKTIRDIPRDLMATWLKEINDIKHGRIEVEEQIKGYQENWNESKN